MSPTLSICGTADDVGKFRFETRIRGAGLAGSFDAPCAERNDTLQGRVGPQTLTLMDCERRWVVNQQTSILCKKKKKSYVRDWIFL